MNSYQILKDKQQKEMNAFPLGAAFSNKQFAEMMQKWGLTIDDTDKILSIGGGCYIRKSDRDTFHSMLDRFEKERNDAIAADKTGYGFIRICSTVNLQITNIASPESLTKRLTRSELRMNS